MREAAAKGNQPMPVDVAGLRQRLGLSQELFAVSFGYSVAALRHWLRGRKVSLGVYLGVHQSYKKHGSSKQAAFRQQCE